MCSVPKGTVIPAIASCPDASYAPRTRLVRSVSLLSHLLWWLVSVSAPMANTPILRARTAQTVQTRCPTAPPVPPSPTAPPVQPRSRPCRASVAAPNPRNTSTPRRYSARTVYNTAGPAPTRPPANPASHRTTANWTTPPSAPANSISTPPTPPNVW